MSHSSSTGYAAHDLLRIQPGHIHQRRRAFDRRRPSSVPRRGAMPPRASSAIIGRRSCACQRRLLELRRLRRAGTRYSSPMLDRARTPRTLHRSRASVSNTCRIGPPLPTDVVLNRWDRIGIGSSSISAKSCAWSWFTPSRPPRSTDPTLDGSRTAPLVDPAGLRW